MNIPRIIYGTSNHVDWIEMYLIIIVFILTPPIIGLTLIIGYMMTHRSASKTYYYAFFACLAIYFASINATKEVNGDQIQYFYAYKNVPNIGFIKSLIYIYGVDALTEPGKKYISGEFMNGIYNYLGYYITFGYYPLYAALLTFTNYFFIFLGLFKFSQILKKPHFIIVCGAIILSFFYLYFSYTLQIQKQFLAQSIMMFVIGSYAVTGRMNLKYWVLTGFAVFTHAATFIFVLFLIIKPLRAKLTKKSLFVFVIVFSLLIFAGPHLVGSISSTVSNTSVLTYGVTRLANSEINSDEEGLVLSQVIVIGIPLFLIVSRKLWLDRRSIYKPHTFILNIVLLLLLSVAAMFRQTLAQYRFFMMLFAFMPFVYPFITNNIKHRDRILRVLSFIMIIWFYYQFEKIVWNYAPVSDIIFKSPIFLLFGNYYNT